MSVQSSHEPEHPFVFECSLALRQFHQLKCVVLMQGFSLFLIAFIHKSFYSSGVV